MIVSPQMENQSSQPETQRSLTQVLRLDNIAEDVQHIIAAELANSSLSSVLAMAQSSRTLRQAALPLIYRDVVLLKKNDDPKTAEASVSPVELFRGRGECSIAHHVRNLVVKDELPTDDLLMILDAISKHGVLRKLR